MGQTADQLRQEIANKRDDAAAKIDRIEAKVQDLPNVAKDTVKETVDQSLNQARASVEEKVGQVKQQVNVQGQIEERPLAVLGAAFAGGFLLAKMFGGAKSDQREFTYQTDWSQAHSTPAASAYESGSSGHEASRMGVGSAASGYQSQAGSQGSSQPNAIISALKGAAKDAGLDNTFSSLSGALVATLTDQFHRTLRETFPEFADNLEKKGGLTARQSRVGESGGSANLRSSGSTSTASASSGANDSGSGTASQTFGTSSGNLSGAAADPTLRTSSMGNSDTASTR